MSQFVTSQEYNVSLTFENQLMCFTTVAKKRIAD